MPRRTREVKEIWGRKKPEDVETGQPRRTIRTPEQMGKLYWHTSGAYGDPVYPVGGTGFQRPKWQTWQEGLKRLGLAGGELFQEPAPKGIIASPNPGGSPQGILPQLASGRRATPALTTGETGWIGPPLSQTVGGGGRVPMPASGGIPSPTGGITPPATQPLLDPYAYFSGTATGRHFAPHTVEGYDPSKLPRLRIPSFNTWLRMGPQWQQQYLGYRQAQTGATPEQSLWNIRRIGPPSGQGTTLTYRR